MPGYYTDKLAAERLHACYDLAPPRIKAYLEAEIEFVLAVMPPIEPGLARIRSNSCCLRHLQ
jgi:hypothetical protein